MHNHIILASVKAAAASGGGLLGQALIITLIGMLILFISLLVLWGVMELLVRFVHDKPEEEEEAAEIAEAVSDDADVELKRKAAAAAAAYVLARK